MSRIWKILCVVLAAVGVASDTVGRRPVAVDPEQLVLVELERNAQFAERTHPRVSSDTSAGGFVTIEGWEATAPQYGRTVVGETSYPIRVEAAGDYWVWARVRWRGTCSNSITLAVSPGGASLDANAARNLVGNDPSFRRWHWVRGPRVALAAGDHVLHVGTREANAAVDCVLFSPQENFLPTDQNSGDFSTEQAATRRALAFSDNFTAASDQVSPMGDRWLLSGDEWRVMRSPGLSAVAPVAPGISLAQARASDVDAAWMQASLLLHPRGRAGVFFGRDETGYVVARLVGAHVEEGGATFQLVRMEGDTARILQSVPLREHVNAGQWQRITVQFTSISVQAKLATGETLFANWPERSGWSSGGTGLYVDATDAVLRPAEAFVDWRTRENDAVTLADFPSAIDRPRRWPGLGVGSPRGDALLLRWANVGERFEHAKRVELVRAHAGRRPEVVGGKWGVFHADDRASLQLNWSGGKVTASVAGEAFASVSAPRETLAGLIDLGHPRALFGEFDLRPTEFVWGEQAVQIRGQRGTSWRLNTPAFAGGVVTSYVDPTVLPQGLLFDVDRNGVLDTLMVEPNTVRWVQNGRPRQWNVDVPNGSTLQAVFDQGVFGLIWNQSLLLEQGRPLANMEHVFVAGDDPIRFQNRTSYATFPRDSNFFALGYGWPAGDVEDRLLSGDVMIELTGPVPSDRNTFGVRFHADRDEPGRGYELLVNAQVQRLEFRRNGESLGTGEYSLPATRVVDLRVTQRGHSIVVNRGEEILFSYYDPQPLREGFVSAPGLQGVPAASGPYLRPRQRWEESGVFHPELGVFAGAAVWQAIAGNWRFDENESGINGYYMGSGDTEAAVLRYRPLLNEEALAVELRVSAGFFQPNQEIALVFEHADGQESRMGVRWTQPGSYQAFVNDKLASLSEWPANVPSPSVTAVLQGDRLRLSVDHRQEIAATVAAGLITGIRLEFRGDESHELAVQALSVRPAPVAANAITQGLRDGLEFLARSRP